MRFDNRRARAAVFLMLVGLTTMLGCNRTPTPDRSAAANTGGSRFTWQYVGKGQLDTALAAANKDGKRVLVGFSSVAAGWWPSGFESGPLSQILNDPAVLKASEKFVRVLLRGPDAQELRDKAFKDKDVSMPGIVFLDAQGKPIGTARLETAQEFVQQLNELTK
jgi:hypothetical protein